VLYINANPSARVELNGKLLGYTPINGKKIKVGRYKLQLKREGYRTVTRTLVIQPDQPADLNVALRPLVRPRPIRRRPVRPRPQKRRRRPPPPRTRTGPQPRYDFNSRRLPRRKRLRIFVSDRRGIVGRIYTSQHKNLCRRIERETARLLGPHFPVKGVTLAWQRFVHRQAARRNQSFYTFYPRAVAYIIYRNLSRGRSKQRVSQLLVFYQRRNRFHRYRNR
jgi:hypothetical protein